jgi:hypothetical protein
VAIGVAVILANLIAFKYTLFLLDAVAASGFAVAPAHDWVTRHVLLPIGISFYSFQLIAVLVDASRGQRLDVRSFRELLLFIMFFGHLIAGPIMRGREFFPQLHVLPGGRAAGRWLDQESDRRGRAAVWPGRCALFARAGSVGRRGVAGPDAVRVSNLF